MSELTVEKLREAAKLLDEAPKPTFTNNELIRLYEEHKFKKYLQDHGYLSKPIIDHCNRTLELHYRLGLYGQ